jgi:cytochrome c oxidase subunit 2
VIVRFNSRANPTPARFTHNTPLEVAWTLIPIVILVFIGSFSLPILFKQQEIPRWRRHDQGHRQPVVLVL